MFTELLIKRKMLLNFEGGKYFTATMAKDKIQIIRENGEDADAQVPVIVSASLSCCFSFHITKLANIYK